MPSDTKFKLDLWQCTLIKKNNLPIVFPKEAW
jgi:hypothetical protein